MNTTDIRTLTTVDELAVLLARAPQPVVIDTSFDLADTDAGERRYRESHLPGAHYLHLDRDLSGTKTGCGVRASQAASSSALIRVRVAVAFMRCSEDRRWRRVAACRCGCAAASPRARLRR